jgi:hypothetical protein
MHKRAAWSACDRLGGDAPAPVRGFAFMSAPDDASDLLTEVERAELIALVDRAGSPVAERLLWVVSRVSRLDDLDLVTRRELATLRIALAVAASAD